MSSVERLLEEPGWAAAEEWNMHMAEFLFTASVTNTPRVIDRCVRRIHANASRYKRYGMTT